jgi:hypothetical protein
MTGLPERVCAEIEILHAFFTGWFTGQLPERAFDEQFAARFTDEFVIIPPSGALVRYPELAQRLRATYGKMPTSRIAIRNVQVSLVTDAAIMATYEEWQHQADQLGSGTGRLSSVLLSNSDPFIWLHVHETWLPQAVQAAGPFDF